MYYLDQTKFQAQIEIKDSIFRNNLAQIEGGAIKFNAELPFLYNNTYENNNAQYGENIAAIPETIIFKVFEKNNAGKIIYDSSKNLNKLFLSNITSGEEIPYIIELSILDRFEKIVSLDY